jgi:hypothetical protein
MNVSDFLECKQWINGPDFLGCDKTCWPVSPAIKSDSSDLEIKSSNFTIKTENENPVDYLLKSASSWYKLKVRVAWFLRLKYCLKNECKLQSKLCQIN